MNESSDVGSTFFIIGVTIVATLGGFLFGFDSGVINGTIEGLRMAFHSTSVGTGFNVASILIGCAVGAFFAGRLADNFGRRVIMMVSSILFIITAVGTGASQTTTEFVIARLGSGLAVGAVSILAPAYISEIAPANLRGTLISLQQVAISVGLFLAFVSNYIIAATAGSATASFWFGIVAWRWMFWIELVPSIAFLIGLMFIPESPRYFVLSGQRDEALEVLTRLYGMKAAQQKIDEIRKTIANKPRLTDLWDPVSQQIKPIIWVGLGLAILQQFVGINVIKYYGAVLWKSVGFTESNALLINIISEAVGLVALAIALATIDRIGRRPLLWIGSTGMTITLAAVAYIFSTATMGPGGIALSPTMGLAALVVVNMYVFFFSFSWGPVMWVMLGEMFPNQIRGSGLAVSGVGQWLSNFGIIITFPILLTTIGLKWTYSIYAVFGLLSLIFVLTLVPETKGRELEEMGLLWKSKDQNIDEFEVKS
jgi:SP family sugar:H+ symporter-like MFS transporter